ncbi:MAG: TetR/AcrR family transcriptional regulator [Chthoniobacteraceae bacterium]
MSRPARQKKRRAPGRPFAAEAPDTAARLFDAALTQFADKGYVAATTGDIIRAAGVTKPVLYHHYENKAALFRELIGGIYEASQRAWASVIGAETTCAGRLRGMIRIAFEGSARDPRIPRLMLQTHYGPPVAELRAFMDGHTARRFAQVVRVMQGGLADDALRGGDAPAHALLFCCIMDQHINVLARFPNAAALLTPALADALVDAFLHGCGTGRRSTVLLPPSSLGTIFPATIR